MSIQVAGHFRRGTPWRKPKTTFGTSPALEPPGPSRNAEPTHGKRASGSCVTARRDGIGIEVMGCRSASLNGWPGTQETLRFSATEMPVEQLGFRDAIVNCVGGWRKLVPAFGGIEQPSFAEPMTEEELWWWAIR